MTHYENAKASWPRTRTIAGGGTRISGSYVQPWLAALSPLLYGALVLAFSFMVLAGTGNLVAALVWGVAMTLLYGVLWKGSITNVLGKLVDIRVWPERVEIRRGLFRKSYDRRVPMAFRLEGAVSSRPVVAVVMQYGERRVVVAEMPLAASDQAAALVARLQEAMEQRRPAGSDGGIRRPVAARPSDRV
ncbi:hypothetical protein [Hyphomicrobium sp. MC8b]|uniref:hypothetical protein n=1 Tax=Hyphomicrobium sp. MC8b TaxID=300273 RepID=UPI00391A93C0